MRFGAPRRACPPLLRGPADPVGRRGKAGPPAPAYARRTTGRSRPGALAPGRRATRRTGTGVASIERLPSPTQDKNQTPPPQLNTPHPPPSFLRRQAESAPRRESIPSFPLSSPPCHPEAPLGIWGRACPPPPTPPSFLRRQVVDAPRRESIPSFPLSSPPCHPEAPLGIWGRACLPHIIGHRLQDSPRPTPLFHLTYSVILSPDALRAHPLPYIPNTGPGSWGPRTTQLLDVSFDQFVPPPAPSATSPGRN